MFLSQLMINVGDNPDRPDWRVARTWLRNLYRVHQRLCMAFPSVAPAPEERPKAYCRPYNPQDFPKQRDLPAESDEPCDTHAPRNRREGFLFRIDYPPDQERGGRKPVILVQSAGEGEPDWDYAFGLTPGARDRCGRPIGNAGYLLAAPPRKRKFALVLDGDALVLPGEKCSLPLRPGELVRFRLRANPTRKVQDGSPNGKRKRINPTLEDHQEWLESKLGAAAASPVRIDTFITGWAYGWRSKHEPQPGQRMQWWSVLFEGSFRVTNVGVLKDLLESGIGSAKAFGCGLLSVAPVRTP